MSHYVYSTLSQDTAYTGYKKTVSGLNEIVERVLINGGHGVANRNVVTPKGVVTQVSDEELEILEKNFVFQMHTKNGFITVEKRKVDTEKQAAKMTAKETSAPVTPEGLKEVKEKVKA